MVNGGGDGPESPAPAPSESIDQSIGVEDDDDPQVSSQATPAQDPALPFRQAPLPDGLEFGSLCLFKVRNRPYWPGRISGAGIASESTMKALRGEGIVVLSFGNHNYAIVPPESIVPFREYVGQKPRRLSGRALRAAFSEAARVQSGEIVLDESTLEIAENAPVRGRAKRQRSSAAGGSPSTAEQRKQFRRKILSQLGLFPPDVLLPDYGLT